MEERESEEQTRRDLELGDGDCPPDGKDQHSIRQLLIERDWALRGSLRALSQVSYAFLKERDWPTAVDPFVRS